MPESLVELLKEINDNIRRYVEHSVPVVPGALFEQFLAYRASPRGTGFHVEGIANPDPVSLDELRGVDLLLDRLCRNTEQFLEGAPCNHVLLYGPRGTGKSSAVKALLNRYSGKGLRLMELRKNALFLFPEIAALVEGRREKYVFYCDDLAFDEDDRHFRELKAALEGSLSGRPANVLLYATSNRRHLLREYAMDNRSAVTDGELHPAETLEEKVSLSDRFGIRLGFPQFDQNIYIDIVRNYLRIRGLSVKPKTVEPEALQWARAHGSFSGRAARQFVDDLEGRLICGQKD